ncbi:UBX domain-containing protein 4 [Drosophila guanche]|uniref:UBX domain-containing protein 4 n=1 Tax=Drosophila guanche TaxID=7266 RepID=A0A3B0KF38_DROGU|nr:UBX domain-containing protein 4 [Drosophila guanche]SPP86950.1 blast:Ribonuclease Oy [Drosophila guanche]
MNWHSGNIAEAVAESKSKNAIFVVYIQGENELSSKLEGFVNDAQVRSRLESSDFVAIKVPGDSTAYGQFMSLYKVVPIPSIFFIGKSGTPLDVATGIIASAEELAAKIDKVLVLAGKKEENQLSTTSSSCSSANPGTSPRRIAGADDKTYEKTEQPDPDEVSMATSLASKSAASTTAPESSATAAPEKPSVSSTVAGSTEPSRDNEKPSTTSPVETCETPAAAEVPPLGGSSASPSQAATSAAAAAERRAAVAAAAAPAPIPTPLPSGPLSAVPEPTQRHLTDSEVQMLEVQKTLEEKRRERLQQEQRQQRESDVRRRHEGRETQAHTQQALTKEQELKKMQERIRRNRQEEQETRDRIRAQIAADRAEQAHRVLIAEDVHSITTSTSTAAVTTDSTSTTSSVDETRLQIRLPGGIHRTKSFPVGALLGTVRVYVRNELLLGTDTRDFTLATSYPRREFRTEDEVKTLLELNLVPNAVVLVLTKEQINRVVRTGGSLMTMLTTVMWAMITPAAKAFDFILKNGWRPLSHRFTVMLANVRWPNREGGANVVLVQGDAAARRNMEMFSMRPMPAPGVNPQPEAPEAASNTPPSSTGTENDAAGQQAVPQPHQTPPTRPEFQQRPGGYQPPRYGDANIRRLHDSKDDKDNKATYNGNSTQQQ